MGNSFPCKKTKYADEERDSDDIVLFDYIPETASSITNASCTTVSPFVTVPVPVAFSWSRIENFGMESSASLIGDAVLTPNVVESVKKLFDLVDENDLSNRQKFYDK